MGWSLVAASAPARVIGHEPAQGLRPGADHREAFLHVLAPVGGKRFASHHLAEAAGNRADGRQRIVQFVAQHAQETLPGLPFFVAQGVAEVGQHQQLVGLSVLSKGAAAHGPASHAARKGALQCPYRRAFEALGKAEFGGAALEHALYGFAHQLLPGAVGQLEALLLVKGEHRNTDLLHYGAQQGAGFQCAQALVPEGIAQRVYLMEHLAQRVVPVRNVRADREILFPQGQEKVGNRLQRAHDPGMDCPGTSQPACRQQQGHRQSGPAR